MSGLFGVVSKTDCVSDVFFGTDYHSHLGTKRGGMAILNCEGFNRAIHNIENSPFRTKFDAEIATMKGNSGIGCISDSDPQPLIVRSHLGNYAIMGVGRINNVDELVEHTFKNGRTQFLEMSGGKINNVELCAALINECESIPEGIRFAQQKIDGSMSILVLTSDGIYAARDYCGRTPLVIGKKEGAYCVAFESSSFINLDYEFHREIGPAEVVFRTAEGEQTVLPALDTMQICTFLWVYYGYPTSIYEGVNVEAMRYKGGEILSQRDRGIDIDSVAGIPDSGSAYAIGYSNASNIPFARPFIKYTPTWPRSFMPSNQAQRNRIAHMKLIPVKALIENKKLLLIDDSIVRGTQMGETTEFLYRSGAKEVHVRAACPPLMFGCKFLNFSRSTSEMELIARRVVHELEGDVTRERLLDYTNTDSAEYEAMVEGIRKQLNFTSLKFHKLEDIVASTGLPECKLCTSCWKGKDGCCKAN